MINISIFIDSEFVSEGKGVDIFNRRINDFFVGKLYQTQIIIHIRTFINILNHL